MDREWSKTTAATEETQKICDQVKSQVQEKTKKKYEEYKAFEYRQLVLCGGTQYLIKVHVGGVSYIHLSVSSPFYGGDEQQFHLKGVEEDKKKEDPLVPF